MDWDIYQLADGLTREADRIRKNDMGCLTSTEAEVFGRMVEAIRQLCLEASPRQIGQLAAPIHHLTVTELRQLSDALCLVEDIRTGWWLDHAKATTTETPVSAVSLKEPREPCHIIKLTDRQRRQD